LIFYSDCRNLGEPLIFDYQLPTPDCFMARFMNMIQKY
jgi:hypothetical protein